MHRKQQKLTLILVLNYMCMAHAQRPSFAGSRPAGGLSQKDKYNHPELAAGLAPAKETVTVDDIGNRFGATNNNNDIKNKLPPRPPVAGGLNIVYPESNYNPLPGLQQTTQQLSPVWSSSNDKNAVSGFATRFGGNAAADNEVDNNKKEVPLVLPTDARGDEALVNQLSQLPQENQPFWFLNFKAIEAQRNLSVANVNAAGPTKSMPSNFAG